MDPTELIPERRAKSWKREHEERCRRHQNNSDQKKFNDPGCGSDQSVLLEIKDSLSDFVKDAGGVEKMEIPANDKLDGCGIVDVENEDAFILRSATEDSECESTNKACVESDLINNLEYTDRTLCDGSRNEILFPFVQTTEGSDFKTENNLLFKQFPEKRGREDFIEINGFNVNFKGDSTKSGHTSGDLSVCEIAMEEESKLPIMFQQCETEAQGNTHEEHSKISSWTETGSSELHKAQCCLLECSAELSGIAVLEGTELVDLRETLPRMDKVTNISLEVSEGTHLKSSGIPEGDAALLTDTKPEALGSAIPRCLDILKDGSLDRVSGQSGFTDVLQGFAGNFRTLPEYNVNTEESIQKTNVSLDTGDSSGNCKEEGEVSSFEIVDLLDNSRDLECINSCSFDLEDRNEAPNEYQKGSLENDDQNGSSDDSIFNSSETPGNVTKKMSGEGTLGIEQEKNLFVELSSDKNSTTPVEGIDITEHFICVLDSVRSPLTFQERDQSASEFLGDPNASGDVNTFFADFSLGNMAVEYKETEQSQGINLGNPTGELYEQDSKHFMDESTEEMTGDTSAGSKYCFGVDTIPEQIKPSETASLHPSETSSEDKKILDLYVSEVEQRLSQKQVLREENQDVVSLRPDEYHFSKLDSSLKKNTAFVRKLKTFTCSQLDSLLKDMSTLNLTKYISEAASAIVEAKLKMTDVMAAVELCNSLHHMYAEFSSHLLENWHRFLSIKKDDRMINQSKLRVDLRFYAEMINVGIFTHKEGLPLLGNVLTVLVNMDREEHNNVSIILSFCRHCGEDYAGLVPRKIRLLAEEYQILLPRSKLLTKEKQRNVKTLLKDYYGSLVKHVMKEHRDLQAFERQNKKILQTRGELNGERKEKWENLKYSYERLFTGMTTFAEILDEDLPVLPEDEYLKDEDLRMIGASDGEETGFTSTIWEDEEEQRFYEYLTDMKEFLPSITVRPLEPVSEISEDVLDAEAEELEEEPIAEGKEDDEEPSPPEPDDIEELESVTNSSNKILMESFLTHLPHCVNREMIDSSAVEFVMNLNTKYNRKKLVKMLFSVPRTRLDLLPFYARFVATLHPVVPDVAMELGQFLKQDFKFHVRKKDQINIESKIKVVRFIGELVKFRMYSKIEALYCLKLLLHDFTHHHIEMCCSLLESCGRFLFRNPDSHQRTKVYLEQMMRKKSVTALDSRYVTMIENAFYYVDPPDTAPFVKKERPPMHEFIRKILYQDLVKANTDKVLRLMRKLEWENSDLAEYSVKCLTMAHNVKYYNIRCLASLLAGLVTHQEMVGTHVVDGVMEDIRLGMEVNLPKYSQRRVAMIKYLGELYNYRMVESSDIFKVLYSLISFGVSLNPSSPSFLDPPEHLFRIRLVCILLETCGQYFNNGISKLKLDYYFTYFQRYFWLKYEDKYWTPENPFPVGVHYLFKDTLTSLRPKLHLLSSFEEANQAVHQMQMEFAPMLSDHMPWLFGGSGSDAADNVVPTLGSDLGTIVEAASEGDDDACTESEVADVTDAETETEGSSHDGRPVKKSIKSVVGEEGEGGEDDEDEFCEALSEFEDGEGEGEQEWGGTSSSPLQQSQGDEASMVAALPQGPTHVDCPEDEDFLSAFDRMVSDNIQDRMRETVKPQQVDISVPLHIKGNAKKTYEQLQETRVEEKSTMNFVLMVRKGHKQQYKSLAVPINSELALNLKNREEAERAEKERVKRLTLDINERLEEEDYQEMLAQAQRPVIMNLNRERKHKYQHPKGAPDADLIFGPKKVR
ncbi:regulator of nonsense transcripts 2 isoform X2 [Zootermopsis nevadensis]|uniref:Regulator of nonsense transcripts 2 n=1 Tax=Zootermopsis nevadensis TaxID=136037 RepID=A0A067RKY2_ZOONE|nr:regulator of nonsense transcripts 2 isoform X2 [Zootermopsis nevadensis]KDR21260.1 Regulator of nonsense transcripts 2 [Zootermopsis nevadensis]